MQALSTRIRIRLYPQTFYCSFNTLRVHTVPTLLRFSPFTCIRIRSEFDTRMFESLIEHALMNKLKRLPRQRSKWVGVFRTFTSSFSKVCGYRRPHVTGFVAFSKVSTLESVFKSLRLQCSFWPDT